MADDGALCNPGEGARERGEPTAAVHGPTGEVAREPLGRLRLDRGKDRARILEGSR
jgi:hypothetical protein